VTLVNRQTYREAMARFGAAVSVVTTDGPAGRFGFTASAVCSVTDDPPTLLVCVNRKNDSHPAMLANGVLCVNTLAAGQQEISGVFGGGSAAQDVRFGAGDWHSLVTGAPVLFGAVVAFDCRIVQVTEVATHSVLFGEVVAIEHGNEHDGLVYFARAYHPVRRPSLP
jgi:flavin reductase